MENTRKKPKLFDIKKLPMDVARLVCSPLILWCRMKRLTPTGEPYKNRIKGGAVLAANHTSFFDPFLLGVAVWYRRMFFLAAEVVMRNKLRSWLLSGVGAIRIDRNQADIGIDRTGTDIEAIRKSVKVLKEGSLLAIFPQGGIREDGEVQTLKSGAILIALQAGVPIIPMHICPVKHWYSRRVVVMGEPFDPKAYIQKKFPSAADMDRAAQQLTEEMNQLSLIGKEQTVCKP